ncbi:MAG: hypothetical protein ACYCW6_14075, partial [Candidatus Xenobia bacterium]
PQEDFTPAQVMTVRGHHAYQWRYNATAGTTYASPDVMVTGTYGPEGQGKDFAVTLHPHHPEVTTH